MTINCDIFISAKTLDSYGNPTGDSQLAQQVHDFLASRGYKVFLSTLSLEKLGEDAYQKAIDDALDTARILIAVGTSAAHLESPWVRYEWSSFFNDVLSGVKPEGHIFVYVRGMTVPELPRALRQRQVFLHGAGSLKELDNFVRNALGIGKSPAKSCQTTPARNTEPNAKSGESEIGVIAAGDANLRDLESAVSCANSSQSSFRYVLLENAFADAVRLLTYRSISAPDFFDAIEEARATLNSDRPFVIVVTDSTVSGKTLSNVFGSHRARRGLALITTHQVADIIIPADRMAAYFLYYLARYTLSFLFPTLRNHQDTRSCVFDLKIRKTDLVQSMTARAFCDDCRKQLLAVGGLDAAARIAALDRLFTLSGEILQRGPSAQLA
jgi:hypothetical protein